MILTGPLAAVLLSGLLPVSPAAMAAQPLRTADQWAAQFASQWGGERPVAVRLSRTGDSWDQYALAYDIDALTAVYLATGRATYVDQGLELLENLVATARPSRTLGANAYRDRYLGWISRQNGSTGEEVPLYESYLWRYGTGLLRVVRQDPLLWRDVSRRARYERLLAFAERNIFAKWYARGANDTIYRSRTHMASHWALISLELARITASAARRATYLAVVHAIDTDLPNEPSSLRGQLRLNPDHPTAYWWDDHWGRARRPGQDVSHGNAVIAYVIEANAAGVDWSDTDLHHFLEGFRLAIWPATARPSQPEGAEYVDGTGAGNGWFSDGFVKLARFDARLQQRLETHDVGRSPQFMANGALNAALLACHGIARAAASPNTPACRMDRARQS